MAINFNGQPIDKIIFNGVEIFGGLAPKNIFLRVKTDMRHYTNNYHCVLDLGGIYTILKANGSQSGEALNSGQDRPVEVSTNNSTWYSFTENCKAQYVRAYFNGQQKIGNQVTVSAVYTDQNVGGVIKSLLYRIKSLFCGVSLCL